MPFSSDMCIESYTHLHTHAKPIRSFLASSALWHITQQHQLPDTSYQNRFGGLLIRPLKKSFLSMEGNVTPILKAEREGWCQWRDSRWGPGWASYTTGPTIRCWTASQVFFSLSRDVGKHPPHRQSVEAKYSFIIESGRVMTEIREVEKMLKAVPDKAEYRMMRKTIMLLWFTQLIFPYI